LKCCKNIYLQGIKKESVDQNLQKDALVAVKIEGKQHAIAVGITTLSGAEM
jgi:predicted ribosome-associated RNA-binding protein Tma20